MTGPTAVPYAPEQAAIRFGCGLSPLVPPPTPEQLIGGLQAPDRAAERFPIEGFDAYARHLGTVSEMRRAARKSGDRAGMRENVVALRRRLAGESQGWFVNSLLRWTWTDVPFRERLALFWADHFTAKGKIGLLAPAGFPYVETAIRPHVAGRFADLLIAAVTHPLMLHFLDQSLSVGPGSKAARRRGGLNENLAREVLELHTLGVDGPYAQADVRQLAELFTGLTYTPDGRFRFRPAFAEPGAETVLGRSYGGDPARLEPIHAVLRDLAVHPATARHIATKLAVHFVADLPDAVLVDHVAARYLETAGDLTAVYGALIEHPAAWSAGPGNVKPPFDFIASTCRALAVSPDHLQALAPRERLQVLVRPLSAMGQPLLRPDGPDGWPEEDDAWVTPQGLSARLRWAVSAPAQLRPDLPDPRGFVDTALGPFASQPVRFAADAAESQADAIGLVLAAPAFQRR